MVFWWPAHTGPDTYDTDEACTMDIAITRYQQLYGESPDIDIAEVYRRE